MIVAVEGARGSGKTNLGRRLAEIIGCQVYKGFYCGTGHAPGEHDPRIKMLGLPVKSWREDIMIVDVLTGIRKPNIILDRTLPSGLAYDKELPYVHQGAALELWSDRANRAGLKLIHLAAPPDVMKQRSPDRAHYPMTAEEEALRIAMFVQEVANRGVPLLQIDTGDCSRERTVFKAMDFLGI